MRFDAMEFLQNLFAEKPVPVRTVPAARPEAEALVRPCELDEPDEYELQERLAIQGEAREADARLRIVADDDDESGATETVPFGPDGWPTNTTADLSVCSTCGSLDSWLTLAGDRRCSNCEPMARTRRVLETAERLREKRPHRIDTDAMQRPSPTTESPVSPKR